MYRTWIRKLPLDGAELMLNSPLASVIPDTRRPGMEMLAPGKPVLLWASRTLPVKLMVSAAERVVALTKSKSTTI